MGREIRMVPPNWEHPRNEKGKYEPLYDEDYLTATKEWKAGYALWEKGEHPSQEDYPYWDYEGTPDEAMCRPKFKEDATWIQMYETVSEGTPVSPPFATKEELVNYLVANGDFWDQSRGDGGWDRANAEKFVASGWAPSFMVHDGKISAARDGS